VLAREEIDDLIIEIDFGFGGKQQDRPARRLHWMIVELHRSSSWMIS